jgi:hypothetical protein
MCLYTTNILQNCVQIKYRKITKIQLRDIPSVHISLAENYTKWALLVNLKLAYSDKQSKTVLKKITVWHWLLWWFLQCSSNRSSNIAISKMIGHGLANQDKIWDGMGTEIFLFATTSRLRLGSTQASVLWLIGTSFLEDKADH